MKVLFSFLWLLVQILYSSSANQQLPSEETQLANAIKRNNVERVASLLRDGIDPNVKHNNTTPLHRACDQGSESIVRLLVEHNAALSAQDLLGFTPMHIAAYHGYVEIVQLLLAAGAGEYADLVDKSGKTALDLARKNNHHATSALLDPYTVLDWSAMWETKEALSCIVMSGAAFVAVVSWLNENVSRSRTHTAGRRAKAVSAENRKHQRKVKQ